MNHVARLLPYM